MKKFRRFAGVLLAMIMALALAAPAFASEGGGDETPSTPVYEDAIVNNESDTRQDLADTTSCSITINNTAQGHTYQAYQIFKGDVFVDVEAGKTDRILSNIQWGDNISEEGRAALAEMFDVPYGAGESENAEAAQKVAEKLAGSNEDGIARTFAETAAKYLTGDPAGTSEMVTVGTYEIDGLKPGYYLVKDQDGSQTGEDDAYTSYIMQVLANVTIKAKADVPQSDKKILEGGEEKDVADYNIGDTVTFKLTGTLPSNFSEYEKYYLAFNDTLSKGLTIDVNSITIKVDEQDAVKDTDYTVNSEKQQDGSTKLTITFSDMKQVAGAGNNKEVVVTYNATLNADAVIGNGTDPENPGNPNKMNMIFSNDPNHKGDGTPPTGETPEETVVVFTFELDNTKVDETEQPLSGAKFKLYREGENGVKEWVTLDENGKVTGWNSDEEKGGILESSADEGNKGAFSIIGLDSGVYYLKEIEAPNGYNLLKDPVKVEIVATYTKVGEDEAAPLTKLEIKIDDGEAAEGNASNGTVSNNIENKKGTVLPDTGGIGTTIFYVVGGTLVIGAGILLVTKKRMSSK